MFLPLNALVALLIFGLSLQTHGQKIDEPRSACSSLNRCNCEFICKTYPNNADENFGLSGKDLVDLQCMDGTTRAGYEALGRDLAVCLNCIRSSTAGAKSSDQLVHWSNICDLAWRTSTSSAVEALGRTFDRLPSGQVSCTNNTLSGRDDLFAISLYERATIPTHPHRTAPANNNDPTPHTQTRATHATKNQEGAVTSAGGNAQTLSHDSGLITGEADEENFPTSAVVAGQASQTTTQAAATTSKKQRKKKKTKKCKNGSARAIRIGFSNSTLGILTAGLGIVVCFVII